jgi:16S rRNA (guanine966-N2)-methyltransferase
VQSALAKQQVAVEIQLVPKDAESFLKSNTSEFDLVLIDPPYEMTNQRLADLIQLLTRSLATNAIVVVERSSREEIPQLAGLLLTGQKSYGDTSVYFLKASAQ